MTKYLQSNKYLFYYRVAKVLILNICSQHEYFDLYKNIGKFVEKMSINEP